MDVERSPGSRKVPSASNQASGGSTLISSLDNLVTYLVLSALIVAINLALIICIVNLVDILSKPIRHPDIPLPLTYEKTTQPDVVKEVVSTTTTSTTAKPSPAMQIAEEVMKYMNLSVSPCDDFYSYACGGWHAMKEVADSTVEISRISTMRERTRKQLIDLLRKTPKEEDPHYKTEPRKCFAACNNKENLQERGTKPFFVFLNSIGKFPILDATWDPDTSFSLPKAMEKLSPLNITTIFSIKRVRNIDEIRFYVGEPDFELPLRGDEAWMKYVLQLLGININDASVKKDIDDMFEFENILYDLSKDDSPYSYEEMSLKDFQTYMPKWFNAVDFFKLLAAGNTAEQKSIDEKTEVFLRPPPYFRKAAKLFDESGGGYDKKTGQPFPPQHIRRAADNYILKVLLSLTSWTDPKFKSLKEFNHPQFNNRETTCMDHVLKLFPEQLLKMYVDEFYQLKTDEYVSEMSTELKTSIRERIKESTLFYSDEQHYAHNKMWYGLVKVGYPNAEPDDALNNVYKMGPTDEFFEYSLETLKHEYNKSLWSGKDIWNSLQISFYADPTYICNGISSFVAVPAVSLQPPAISLAWPRSMNYGAMGTFLSHEFLNFWSSSNYYEKEYANIPENLLKKKCLIDKYNKYIFQGSQINGQATIKGIIYENEGIKSSFRAYQNFIKTKGMEQQLIGLNFTHNQLFFINYAQALCQKIPKSLTDVAVSRNELPNKIRVLGTLMNFKEFAEVFKCKSGALMNPPSKCPYI